MKHNKIFFLIFMQFLLVCLFLFPGNTPANLKAQPPGIDENMNLIKVGISTNDFSQLEYNQVSVTSKGAFEIVNKRSGVLLDTSEGNDVYTFKVEDEDISVYKGKTLLEDGLYGSIGVIPQDTDPVEIVGLKRAGKPALYRGEIEIVKSPTKDDKLSAVNVIPIEEYLKGVVPNEMPSYFGLEALKAQAIAARNYAIKPRAKTYQQFDICDSVACQVYFGYNTETARGTQAVEETRGLVGIYNDDLILALYSSTAGGYTENYENAFTENSSTDFPRPCSKPYLKGKPDNPDTPVLDNENNARVFYTNVIPGYENDSGFYRWTRKWSEKELEDVLNKNLPKYRNTGFVYPYFGKNLKTGVIKKVEVVCRGVSGKAMIVKITATNGVWMVKKEIFIRRIFENGGKMLPSANIVIDNTTDANGNLAEVFVYGGGLGHGVGMSQFGANGMSQKNFTFDQILQHYYDKISIGTAPVVLSSAPKTDAVYQRFYITVDSADLIIDNSRKLNSMKVIINSNEINIPLKDYSENKIRISLENYINNGVNDIIYFPPKSDEEESCVKAWVEVYKAADD